MTRALHNQAGTGCTVGVCATPQGMLFFKNRDLAPQYLTHRITIVHSTPDVHALQGVNLQTGTPEGTSIGVNRARVCVANTHIVSTTDVTYDILCERLLNEVAEQQDVMRVVAAFMSRHTVQGGRILIASPRWGYLIEVLQQEHRYREIELPFVITNQFELLPRHSPASPERELSSATRLQTATSLIRDVAAPGQLKSLLRSHLPERGELSICNHRRDGGGTESSHIIQIQGEYVGWSALYGFPCENDYVTMPLF